MPELNAEQVREAIEDLNDINGTDPESAHADADDIVLALLPVEVAKAYGEVTKRCRWWAYA